MARKTITKLTNNLVEISIVRLEDGREFRSWVKKMTLRHALNFGASKAIEAGTKYTVEHAAVGRGSDMFSPVVQSLGLLDGGIYYSPGSVPADYR